MMNDMYMICNKNEFRIEKNRYISLAHQIFGVDNLILPTYNIQNIDYILNNLLNTLTEREEKILRLRYGLHKNIPPHTLQEIGTVFKVSREKICQIEAKALRKLKHPIRSKVVMRCIYDCSLYSNLSRDYIYHIKKLLEVDIENYSSDKKNKTLYLDKIIKRRKLQSPPALFNSRGISIDEMNYSVRTYNCLKRAGYITIEDILKLDMDNLMQIRNIGRKSVNEVLFSLEKLFSVNSDMLPLTESEINSLSFADNRLQEVDTDFRRIEDNSVKIFLENICIDSLFDACLSPALINLLLINGYTDINQVMKNYKDISNDIKHQNFLECAKELEERANKYDDFSLIIKLDLEVLNLLTTNQVNNISELKSIIPLIKNESLREKINDSIFELDKKNLTTIFEYKYLKPDVLDATNDDIFSSELEEICNDNFEDMLIEDTDDEIKLFENENNDYENIELSEIDSPDDDINLEDMLVEGNN